MNNNIRCEHGMEVCYVCDLFKAEERIAELEKDLAFYKCCMLSGEVAGVKDTPSYKAKELKEQGE